MLGEQRLNHFDDLFLLTPWESASGFEHFLQPALGGGAFRFRRLGAQQHLDTDSERVGQGHQHVTTRRLLRAFPERNVGLRQAQFAGQLNLGQSGGLTQSGQMLSGEGVRSEKGSVLTIDCIASRGVFQEGSRSDVALIWEPRPNGDGAYAGVKHQ